MDAIDKLQLLFGRQFDKEMLKAANEASLELVTQFLLILELEDKDHKKLKCIQSKKKETKKEFRKIEIKIECYNELLKEHFNIEYRKLANNQYFNIPETFELSDIFKKKVIKFPPSVDDDDELDEVNEMDHIDCVQNYLGNAYKKLFVDAIFIFELKKIEREIKAGMISDPKIAFAEKTSSEKKYSDAIINEMEKETSASTTENYIQTKFLQIFKEGGAELFCYLQTEYTINNNHPVAKYSYIYRFLLREQLINLGCQSNYMQLIEETIHTKMSKIFTESIKYEDDILPLFNHLRRKFNNRNKKEMN